MELYISENDIAKISSDREFKPFRSDDIDQHFREGHKYIQTNLIVISVVCILACFIVIAVMMYDIIQSLLNAKSNAERRKKRLYELSMYFIICFMIMTICLFIVLLAPQTQGYFDFFLQILLWIQIMIYLAQWDEAMRLYIKQKFTVMLMI